MILGPYSSMVPTSDFPILTTFLVAALQADRIVVSRDETVRVLFRQCCPAVKEIRSVLWANPEIEAEEVVSWLEGGARMEMARRLGVQAR